MERFMCEFDNPKPLFLVIVKMLMLTESGELTLTFRSASSIQYNYGGRVSYKHDDYDSYEPSHEPSHEHRVYGGEYKRRYDHHGRDAYKTSDHHYEPSSYEGRYRRSADQDYHYKPSYESHYADRYSHEPSYERRYGGQGYG